MVRHHVIISGTGRAGTTFLVQLLTQLGLDTGFESTTSGVFANCNAGMEHNLRDPAAPYIVKDPWLCATLPEVLASGDVVIDHAIVPVRDLYAAAESRRDVSRRTDPELYKGGDIPGGLWQTNSPEGQERVLLDMLYQLIYTLTIHDIPVTFLHHPRIIRDPHYLYDKLSAILLGAMPFKTFAEAYRTVCRPELSHDFGKAKSA